MAESNEILNRGFDQVAGGSRYISIPGSHQEVFDWDASGNPIYIGVAYAGAETSDATWLIKKITWDASGNPTSKKTATGIWDNRASLTYT